MISESWTIRNFKRGKLLFLAACLTLAGTLMLSATSFGAWVADSTFNSTVVCNPGAPNPQECVETVVELPNGQVLIGGYFEASSSSGTQSWVARLNTNGSVDTSFMPTLDASVEQIVVQSNGNIIIGGHFTQVNGTTMIGVARLSSLGVLDTTFNPHLNNCDPSQPGNTQVTALALQNDGNLLVGGTFKNVNVSTCPTLTLASGLTDTTLHPFFIRLNTAVTGTGANALDPTFTPKLSSTPLTIITMDTGTFAPIANRRIIVGGAFYKMNCAYCGAVSYPTTTIQVYTDGTPTTPACIDSDGATLVEYGQCLSNNSSNNPQNYPPINTLDISYISLITMGSSTVAGGSQDSSFQSKRSIGEDLVYSIARQGDGTLIVGGGLENFGYCSITTTDACNSASDCPGGETCLPDLYLQRMNADGSVDYSWNPGVNGNVNAVLSSPTGTQLIAGGTFTAIGGQPFNNVALFTSPSGSLDPTFNPNANGSVYAVASSPSGTNITIGGGFTLLNGVPHTSVARLYNDGKSTTSTAISMSANPVTYGTGTVTVTVSGVSSTPTGSVGLSIDSGPTTTKSLTSGSALFSTATVSAGSHALTATYGGTATYEASFATGSLTVIPATLIVTANSVSRPYLGSNPTFTASYTGFVNGQTASVLIGSPSLTTSATTTSPIGTYSIIATGGTLTALNYGFNFVNGTLTVTAIPSTTSVVSSSPTSTYGNPVTFTATVNSTATGSVTFMDGGATLGSGIVSNGTASYVASLLTAGTHTITAVYSGDLNFSGSTSGAIAQTVNKALPTTSVIASSPTSTYGNLLTFTATVATSGSGTATGNVTFNDGGTPIGTGTLSGGIATFSTSTLNAAGGPQSITAVYSGDSNFLTSTSSSYAETINKASSTTTVASSANPAGYGTAVTFTATVTGAGATGIVTFKDGVTTLGTGTVLAGIATYTTSTLSVGGNPHSITAVYGGDTNYTTSTASAYTETINQAASTTSISSSANPSTFGGPLTFTAIVTTGATGTVTFLDGPTILGSGILSNSTATYTTSALSVVGNPHSITAVYSGDTNFTTSTSSPFTQTINKATPTTTVTSNSTPTAYGSPVTFTATVATVGTGTTTGTVTFNDGGTQIGTSALSSGIATFTTSSLSVGGSPHSITAVYSGDANFLAATSSAYLQAIIKTSSAIGVSSTPNPSNYGGSVTFIAAVTSGATGTVTFNDNGAAIGTGTVSGGMATMATSILSGGTHTITAVYAGDTNFNGATSTPILQTVNRTSTTTSVSPSTTSTTYGSSVTFTATVFSGATGTVTFYDGGSAIGAGTLTGGIATFSTTSLGVVGSPHTITATYGGDTNYNTSTSASVLVSIAKASTVTGITSNIQSSAINQPVIFTATVASTGGNPSGTVQFYDGVISLGTATISGGTSTFVYALTSTGTHTITATYSGDANFLLSSTTTPDVQTVVLSTTTTSIALTAGTNPSTYGTLLTFSSTVTGSGGIPTGTITFKDNGSTIIGTGTLVSGIATLSTTSLGGGSNSITATYSGDFNFGGSISSPALSQTVNPASQAITFGALTAQTYGAADYSPGATANSGLAASYASSNTAVATIVGSNIHIAGVGSTTITASQAGNSNYTAATPVTQTLTVNPASLTVTANNANRPYDTANPTFTASYSGFVNGDSAAVVSGSPSFATTATIASQPGNYPITVAIGTLLAANYTFSSFVTGTLTVGPMPQTIIFSSLAAKTYGNADFSPGAAASSGLPVSYASSNTAVATVIGNNIHIVGAGSATITASQPGDGITWGAATPVLQSLNVNPAPLTVTANDASRAYGAANPTFTANYSGFVNGDTAAVVNGSPVFTTTATASSQPGPYPITVAIGTLSTANYTFSNFVPGTLTVNLQSQSIAFGSLPTEAVGDADFAPGAVASSGLSVSYTSSNTSVATIVNSSIHIVGAGTTTITASQAGNSDYAAATSVQQTLNVDIADGTISGTGTVSVTDALEALRIAAGIDTPTQADLAHLDVAPLVNGQRHPDGKIDLADVVVILRKAAGLPSW